MLSTLSYKKVESIADGIINEFKIFAPPVPIEEIIKGLSLEITEFNFENGISGILVITQGKGFIGINPQDSSYRKRFALAHELGHFLMHKESKDIFLDKDFIIKWRNVESNKNYTSEEMTQEQEANTFAASLLMPKPLIESEISNAGFKDLGEVELMEQLAVKFEVSLPAMAYRITNINSYYT